MECDRILYTSRQQEALLSQSAMLTADVVILNDSDCRHSCIVGLSNLALLRFATSMPDWVVGDWVNPARQEMLSAFAGVCLWADRVW